MKQCIRCLQLKPLSEFYKHAQMADSHVNVCKTCAKKRISKNWYLNAEENREKERERWQRRKHDPDVVEHRRKYLQSWRNKKKLQAHNTFAKEAKAT